MAGERWVLTIYCAVVNQQPLSLIAQSLIAPLSDDSMTEKQKEQPLPPADPDHHPPYHGHIFRPRQRSVHPKIPLRLNDSLSLLLLSRHDVPGWYFLRQLRKNLKKALVSTKGFTAQEAANAALGLFLGHFYICEGGGMSPRTAEVNMLEKILHIHITSPLVEYEYQYVSVTKGIQGLF